MYHCKEFKAMDIWHLIDNEKFSERTLAVGFCPCCNKPVAELIQKNEAGNCYEKIVKSGFASDKFVNDFRKDVLYSFSSLNRKRFKSSPSGWVYGIGKVLKKSTRQYKKDFYGRLSLVKEILT